MPFLSIARFAVKLSALIFLTLILSASISALFIINCVISNGGTVFELKVGFLVASASISLSVSVILLTFKSASFNLACSTV